MFITSPAGAVAKYCNEHVCMCWLSLCVCLSVKVNQFGWNVEHFEYIVGLTLADFGRDLRSSECFDMQAKFFLH